MPVFLPSDAAIPAREIPATARFERAFLPDHEVLQREQKDAAPALMGIAYAVVVAVARALLVLLAWGLHRLGTAISGPPAPVERQQPREPAAVAA